jgi:hypothetical protein
VNPNVLVPAPDTTATYSGRPVGCLRTRFTTKVTTQSKNCSPLAQFRIGGAGLGQNSKVEVQKIEIPLAVAKELTVSQKATEWAVFVNTASTVVLEETHTHLSAGETKSEASKYAAISFNDESDLAGESDGRSISSIR